ncbi:MAG: dienelactone hydrolase [Myxococcota bacterium]
MVRPQHRATGTFARAVSVLKAPATIAGLSLAAGCATAVGFSPDDYDTVMSGPTVSAPDPSLAGPHTVQRLYYGSGKDKNRAEFRDSGSIVTQSVDASTLVRLGDQADSRNGYWGFAPDSFPINARVWYPDGDGPFPVVLAVHGNHNMKDFSDPGYGYLGELLASRGYIFASVDMNFINGGIRGENDGRGWLLLKHLQAWKDFNERSDTPFEGKVDLTRVALIGHSRGGEAVAHAAAFNRLSRYPDDASLEFDFNFGIRGIVAIAPVDGQYLPADRHVPVSDVNYLVFHGSHDGDVTSFHGLRQWNRIRFTDDTPRFKSAVYVYRANHGQWNSVWGPSDNGPRSARILDVDALIPEEDQRQFAEVYISAFLDTVVKDDTRYLPVFRDHRRAAEWLPRTMYFNQFQESSFRSLADFEEDVDVTSGSVEGIALHGDSLATWREADLKLRSSNRANTSASQMNQVLWLGWNRKIRGDEETLGQPGRYTLTLSDAAAGELNLDGSSSLDLMLAPTEDKPSPRSPAKDEDGNDEGGNPSPSGASGDGDEAEDSETPDPIDLSIEIEDASGNRASVKLSDYGVIRYPLKTEVLRRRDREASRFSNPWELVLQSFSIPLSDFAGQNRSVDLTRVRAVHLVFDLTPLGTVVVDNIGFSKLDPAYFR